MELVNPKNTTIYNGGISVDDRGTVSFVNDFSFKNVMRFYQITNHSTNYIRAFHGHLKEEKYVYVPNGTALLCIVPFENVESPNKKAKVERFILSSKSPKILYIPAGYANGVKTLEENTTVIFYSTSTLEESMHDDYRFPYDFWGKEIWESENR